MFPEHPHISYCITQSEKAGDIRVSISGWIGGCLLVSEFCGREYAASSVVEHDTRSFPYTFIGDSVARSLGSGPVENFADRRKHVTLVTYVLFQLQLLIFVY